VAATTTETRLVYVAIALSGLTALGSEVVWTRVLSLIFGTLCESYFVVMNQQHVLHSFRFLYGD